MNSDICPAQSMAYFKLGLAFQDPEVEKAYLEYSFLKNRVLLVWGLVLLGCITLLQAPLDLLNPPAQRHIIQFFRFAVWLPTLAIGIVVIPRTKNPTIWIPLSLILGIIQGILFAVVAPPFGALSFDLVLCLTMMFLIGQYFFTGMPFRWGIAVAIVTHVSQILIVMARYPGNPWLIVITVSIPLSGSMIGFCAYRFERVSRENFIAQKLLQAEYNQRLAAEQKRVHWLETFTGFLRHELKNAMTGIGSSLDLAANAQVDEERSKYHGRAKYSLEFMRQFLGQAAEATSLETALIEQELEPVCLSQLVEGRVLDYCKESAKRIFVSHIEPDIWVLGNADRLVQMLDKLANNAMEHGAPEHPIDFVLRRHHRQAILIVKDIGEPLPNDLDRIFEPFASNKRHPGKDNLGLGLYVVKVIATSFGGRVLARRLNNPDGAELVIEIPCHIENRGDF